MLRQGGRIMLIGAAAAGIVLVLGRADAAFGPVGQDQRISFMGPNGNPGFDAQDPDAAYNPTADEYLVVWAADDNTPPLVNEEWEIYAQRLSARGVPVGGRIRVSEQGADGNAASDALSPSVAYNAATNEYLVVWQGGGATVWGHRLSATGERLGGRDDVQIAANDYFTSEGAPSVAANSTSGEYLVTWVGNLTSTAELEVFGQFLTAAGAVTGADDFRISAQGADGDLGSGAYYANVVYNPDAGHPGYLVVWTGEVGSTDEFEIWGRRLSATGDPLGGPDDLQISAMGPPGNPAYDADGAQAAVNTKTGEYLVVWFGDDNTTPLVDGEYEIFGQLLTASGAATGPNDFRISEQGADGNPDSSAGAPSVAYEPVGDEYLVAWSGEIGTTNQFEIWAQRLSAMAGEIGGNDFQLSTSVGFLTGASRAVANPTSGEYLVVWPEDRDVTGEEEIYGHWLGLVDPTLLTTDPPGPANNNNPRIKGSVDPSSTVDVFTNSLCLGAPAVNDAPAGALNGAGIAVVVADNTTTEFSATASSDGRTSRCSNSIPYTEVSPPGPPPPPHPPSPPPPPAAVDSPPAVSGFTVSPRRFRAGRRSSFRFRLSERATARIVIERILPGRKKRVGRAKALGFRNRPAGQNRIAFRARRLKPGTYRATIVTTDGAGQRSTPRRAAFRLVRRR